MPSIAVRPESVRPELQSLDIRGLAFLGATQDGELHRRPINPIPLPRLVQNAGGFYARNRVNTAHTAEFQMGYRPR
ncbi:Uncharacterised protein [Vibrio cholerae]|nr:Uncharacterised protein [Vibrio cholerae]